MTKLDKHYTDPRLVAIYDIENPRGIDTDFYLALADELNAKRIIDLGCGTGLLTCEFVTSEREVIGIDPSSAMLAVAKQQANAEKVTWIEGDASAIGQAQADLLVMTGNVAQIFLDDDEWLSALQSIHSGLRSGGYLVFEVRNPKARGWEQWNKTDSYFKFDSPHGTMETWVKVTGIQGNLVHFEGHNVFLDKGDTIIVESTLRFRSHEEISTFLADVGFTVEHVYGDWKRGALQDNSRTMVFIARRN
ncbi:MAG: class I SAM-dependent methyltransferase [Chloroflexota bacterium]